MWYTPGPSVPHAFKREQLPVPPCPPHLRDLPVFSLLPSSTCSHSCSQIYPVQLSIWKNSSHSFVTETDCDTREMSATLCVTGNCYKDTNGWICLHSNTLIWGSDQIKLVGKIAGWAEWHTFIVQRQEFQSLSLNRLWLEDVKCQRLKE